MAQTPAARAATTEASETEAIAVRIPPQPLVSAPDRLQIAEAVATIARVFAPRRVVLFGSRAYGVPYWDSDIDLMVEQDSPLRPSEQIAQIRRVLADRRLGARIDIHVRTPEDVRVGLAEGDLFLEDVFLKGVLLHGEAVAVPIRRGGTMEPGDGSPEPPRLSRAARDWLAKGETDYRHARYSRDAPTPFLDQACFSAQQSAEKYLKGLIEQRGVGFRRTHDLVELVARVVPPLAGLADRSADLEWLSEFAPAVRYPGREAGPDDADQAIELAGLVRAEVRAALGLPPD